MAASSSISIAAEAKSETPAELAQYYGFSGLELIKLHDRAFNLTPGDFNSDGLTDVLVVDNHDSCLRLLTQRRPDEKVRSDSPQHVNDLKTDSRFENRAISVDKQVAGLAAGDFNADGRLDLAYVGLPDRLVIRYQPEKPAGEWSDTWSVRLPGLVPAAWILSSGDLNSDGRSDLVVLGKNVTYIVYQDKNGEMKAAERVINTSNQLSLVHAADISGDGRDDVCYMANEGSTRGLCARLQTADGRLGPELNFSLEQPRSVTVTDVNDQPGREIVTIDQRSGRVIVSHLHTQEADDQKQPRRLVHFGIGDGSSSGQDRAIVTGDLDGDQLTDVIVTDPENAQVLVFRQNGIDGLGPAETFPGLLGATDLCAVDFDRDGRSELVLMSEAENSVAFSRFENGRVTFPQPIMQAPENEVPAGINVLNGPQKSILVVCTKTKGRSDSTVTLHQRIVSADGADALATEPFEISAAGVAGSRGLKLLPVDLDEDSHPDLLLAPQGTGGDGLLTLRAGESGVLQPEPDSHRLSLGKSSAESLFVRGSSLLLARDAFAREMALEESGWQVADQFNAAEAKARISGAVAMDYDNDGTDDIVLIDTGINRLRVLRSDSGLYRPWVEVELGDLKFRSAFVEDLNGDKADDLLLFGNQRLSILYSGRAASELKELASWESKRDDAYPADVIAGDINGDSVVDLTIIDTSIDGLELLRVGPEYGLESATHFRVFEEKRLVTSADTRGTEPREGVVADVTGDGRMDLLLLCHDQLIVYPQDSGEDVAAAEKQKE